MITFEAEFDLKLRSDYIEMANDGADFFRDILFRK